MEEKQQKKGIKLDLKQLLFSASAALDAVEEELLGATQNHGRRVAYLSAKMGKKLGFTAEARTELAVYASLHDNALTEYIATQKRKGIKVGKNEIMENFQLHCILGEENIEVFPVKRKQKNIIKYHHENWDGSGLFGIKGEQIPLMSQIIHLSDVVDVAFPLRHAGEDKRKQIENYLKKQTGSMFQESLVERFLEVIDELETAELADEQVASALVREVPVEKALVSYEELIEASALFAHIIDYKSPFTMNHSSGIAQKAKLLAEYYEFDESVRNELYVAAFLHDIGKLAVPEELLEKKGKLTSEEYEIVKKHAERTDRILREVDSFERIAKWASSHHERLDGSGYFRGTTGESQDFCSRVLACVDMYQALVEERPYREGMSHTRAMMILNEEVEKKKLDGKIVSDIDHLFCNRDEKK